MSLLMDALKKAEREREAQASKEQNEDNETPQELSLDPMEEQPEPELPQLGDEDEPWDILGEPGEVSHGFDLSLTDSDLGLDASSDSAPEPDVESEPQPEPRFEPHDLDGMEDIPLAASPDDDLSIEDTSSTMPSMKAVKASVDRYFDGSQSVSVSMQMPLEQDDATTVVQRREHHEEAQAAAQTVFAAKTPKPRSSRLVWFFVVPLVLIVPVGGGFFYWVQITGGQGVGGTDLVALLGGSTGQSTTTTSIQTTTTTGTQVTSAGETVATTQTASAQGETSTTQGVLEPALSDVLDIEPPAAGDLTPVELEPVVVEAPEPAPVVEEVLPTAEELLASADAQIQSALDDQVMTEGELARESVSFIRSRPEPKINVGVRSGYEAFQAGNYAQAERNYRRALSEEPTNRDALLGLAAIAVHKERWPVAAGIYTQLLRINPRDTVAQSAMIAMQSNAGSPENESRIKLMLDREPQAGHLHFSLGNLYASQSRWAEAQIAYFNAYRLDSGNADYAYNLAVGLDHLAKAQAAARYYHLALELGASNGAGFDPADVTRRIQSIGGAASQ